MIKRVNIKKRFEQTDYFIENHEYSQNELIHKNISLLNWNIQKKNRDPVWSKACTQLKMVHLHVCTETGTQ